MKALNNINNRHNTVLPGFGVEVVFENFVDSEAIGLVEGIKDFVNFVVVVAVEIVVNLVGWELLNLLKLMSMEAEK